MNVRRHAKLESINNNNLLIDFRRISVVKYNGKTFIGDPKIFYVSRVNDIFLLKDWRRVKLIAAVLQQSKLIIGYISQTRALPR